MNLTGSQLTLLREVVAQYIDIIGRALGDPDLVGEKAYVSFDGYGYDTYDDMEELIKAEAVVVAWSVHATMDPYDLVRDVRTRYRPTRRGITAALGAPWSARPGWE